MRYLRLNAPQGLNLHFLHFTTPEVCVPLKSQRVLELQSITAGFQEHPIASKSRSYPQRVLTGIPWAWESVNVSNWVTDIQGGLEYYYIVSRCLCMFYLWWGETRVLLCHLIHLLHCSSPNSKPPVTWTLYPSVDLSVYRILHQKGTILGRIKRFHVIIDSWLIATNGRGYSWRIIVRQRSISVGADEIRPWGFYHVLQHQQDQSINRKSFSFIGLNQLGRHTFLDAVIRIYNKSLLPSQLLSKLSSNSDVNTDSGAGRPLLCWEWQTLWGRHLSGYRSHGTIPARPGPAPPRPPWGGAAWRCAEQRRQRASAWRTDPWDIQAPT